MTILGLDFDNTIVEYGKLFHKLALEKKLIGKTVEAKKKTIRDSLRKRGMDDEFTILQGEVYGSRILQAEPAEGMLETLYALKKKGIKTILISHKTKVPYAGPKYDLHKAAILWLEHYGFFNETGMNWRRNQVFLEETKEKKISRIISEKCTHYIDDLPSILKLIPDNVNKFLYDKYNEEKESKQLRIFHWKELLNKIDE